MAFDGMPAYLAWANFRAAQMLRQTPSEEGVLILAHLLAAERVWAERVVGAAVSCPLRPAWTLPECEAAVPLNVQLYRDILAEPSPPVEVHYRNTQGAEFVSARADILTHVLAHGAYHRGQISQEVRRLGGEVLDTDLILFRREASS